MLVDTKTGRDEDTLVEEGILAKIQKLGDVVYQGVVPQVGTLDFHNLDVLYG